MKGAHDGKARGTGDARDVGGDAQKRPVGQPTHHGAAGTDAPSAKQSAHPLSADHQAREIGEVSAWTMAAIGIVVDLLLAAAALISLALLYRWMTEQR